MSSRSNVIDSSRAYFRETFTAKTFVPGETYIPPSGKVVDEDDLAALIDASLDMWLTAGRYAREFESTIPKHFGRETQALLVNSGSSANLVAITSMGSTMFKPMKMKPLEKGDEVLTAAAGFPTTVNPIIQNGWVPVFVDVDEKTLNVKPETLFAARTPKTRAVVLAHTLGNPYRSDIISEWCKKEGLFLIEDCCDALGAEIETADGVKNVGAFANYATVSFYPAHHITMGEGGAVMSMDQGHKRIAESIRDWGRDCWCEPGKDNTCDKRFSWKLGSLPPGYDHKYTYSQIGYNLKVTDMQAALGVSQLKKLDRFVKARNENYKFLTDGIRSSKILSERFQPVEATAGTRPSWFGLPMFCRDGLNREKVTQGLETNKVGTRLVFAGNLTKQPAYKHTEFKVHGELKTTDRVMNQAFWIAVHPQLDKAKMTYILETMEKVVKSI